MGQSMTRLPDLPGPGGATAQRHRRLSEDPEHRSFFKTKGDRTLHGLKSKSRSSVYPENVKQNRTPKKSEALKDIDANSRALGASTQQHPRKHHHSRSELGTDKREGRAVHPHRIRKTGKENRKQRTGAQLLEPYVPKSRGRHAKSDIKIVTAKVKEFEPKRPPPPTRNCTVCMETRTLRHFPHRPPTSQCTHEISTCKRCLKTWITSQFGTKIWDQISCPECGVRLLYDDMQEFASLNIFRRYDRLSTKATLESIPGFRWCIAKGCKSGQVHEGGLTPRFRCVACKASHCVVHQVRWHKGETCAEYDYRTDGKIKKAEEDASKKLIKEVAKKCPGCQCNIEKNNGCDHMSCSKCKHQFCWICLAPYKPIREHGNRMHRPNCAHYA